MGELNCMWVFGGWFVRLPKYTMIDALQERDSYVVVETWNVIGKGA